MTWLGRDWRIGTDDFAVYAVCACSVRIGWLGVVVAILSLGVNRSFMSGVSSRCDVFLTAWAIAVTSVYASHYVIEALLWRASSYGSILGGVQMRQKTVPPLLTARLVLQMLEAGVIGWGLYLATAGDLDYCDQEVRTSVDALLNAQRVVAWAHASSWLLGVLSMLFVLGPKTTHASVAEDILSAIALGNLSTTGPVARPLPTAWSSWFASTFFCSLRDADGSDWQQIESQIARLLATVVPAELDLTFNDLLAALVLVSQQHAQQIESHSSLTNVQLTPSGQPERLNGRAVLGNRSGFVRMDEGGSFGAQHGASNADATPPMPLAAGAQPFDEPERIAELERWMWACMGVYGWPLYAYRLRGTCCWHAPCALASLCCLRCCSTRGSDGDGDGAVSSGVRTDAPGTAAALGDNVLGAGRSVHDAALLQTLREAHERHAPNGGEVAPSNGRASARRAPVEVRAAEWSNTLEHKPFCLLVDREHCEVIVAIRGTLSVADIATDAMAHPHPLPPSVEGAAADHGKAAAHGGVCKAAMALERTLVGSGVLGRLLLGEGSCKGFALIITGHSLGAGVAAVLALLIRDAWRAHQVDVRCVAFAPPGGMLSRGVAAASRAFTTSVFVENDVVPTLSLATTELLRDELLHALCFSRASKAAIAYDLFASTLCGCTRRRGRRVHVPPPPLCIEGDADADGHALAVDWQSAGDPPSEKARLLLASHRATRPDHQRPLWPPGRLIRLRRGTGRGTWRAEELPDAQQLRRIRLPLHRGVVDHMPDKVLKVLQLARAQASAGPMMRFV